VHDEGARSRTRSLGEEIRARAEERRRGGETHHGDVVFERKEIVLRGCEEGRGKA